MRSAATALIGLSLMVAGCGGTDGNAIETTVETNNGAADSAARLAVSPDGLTLVNAETGAAHHINFGVSQAMAERTATAALGAADETGSNAECPAGAMTMVRYGTLTLNIMDGRFAGWSLDERGDGPAPGGITTMGGVGLGTSRAELEDTLAIEMVDASTLGTEFTSGNLSGLLSGTGSEGRVTNLWAGMACNFR